MKGVPSRGVWIGLAALLAVFAAVALYAMRSLEGAQDSLEKNADIGDEAGVAVSEMKEGVAGIGRGTVDYVRTGAPKHREVVVRSRETFEGARARYQGISGENVGGEIGRLYDEYDALSGSLMEGSDEREAARGRIDGDFATVKRILGDETRETLGSREPDKPEKLEETAKMSGAVAGAQGAFGDYLREPSPERSKDISGNVKSFRVALGRFEKLPLDDEERGRADELKKRFDAAVSGIQDILRAGRTAREDERRFASLRTELDAALDREVREIRSEQAARAEGSTSQALGRARALILGVLAAVVVALAVALLAVTGVVTRAWRGVARLGRRGRGAAGRLLRGDISVERWLLPLGLALAALLWLAQSALEAYAFGGDGDFLGALVPRPSAGLLSRVLVAVAIVALLAYVQYVLKRRKQREEARAREDRREKEIEARSRLAAVVESSDDAIIGRTLDGVITSWNSGAQRLYGYGAEEVVGGYGFELAPPDRLNEMLGLLEKLRRGESVRTYETVHKSKGGRLIDVALTISEIRDSSGVPIGYSSIARDITERKRSEERLRQQKDLYEALLYAQSEVGEGLLILEDGRIVYTNEAFSEISGYGPEELKALPSVLDLVAAEEREPFAGRLERAARGRTDGDQQTAILHKSGRRVTVETGIKTVEEDGRTRLIVILRDITERKRAEEALQESEEKYRMLVETVQEGFGIIDADERITYCNAAYAAIFDSTPQELVGRSLLEFVEEEGREELLRQPPPGNPGANNSYEITIRTEGGKCKDLSASATPVVDADGHSQGAVHAIIDITERKRAEEQLAYMARYDHLTGLGNRVLFGDRLTRAVARADRNEAPVALMFLDLDRFKSINDTLGHEAGDELLKGTAGRLRACVRETDTLARMGGDEFAVILEGLSDGKDAAFVARKIVDALAEPFDLDGHEVFVTTSIGIAVSPPSPDEDLVRDADAAMYHAKQIGRNTYQFYTPEMNVRAHERLSLETSLRGALDRDEFVLHYQPQIELATGRIVGAEALLRWRQPYSSTLVQPDEFIEVLEESGLIVPVGDWVLRAACAQGKAWEAEGLPPLRVAVNLSTRQFKGENLAKRLSSILHDTGMDPSCLELELTESLLMEDAPVSSAMLHDLRVLLGLNLSIDDFGTGYSSLSYLKRFPLDALKVDRSFVRDIATDPNDAAIVTSIINLAHNLHLKVIAEGVETEEQLAYLKERGCDVVQGFYFSEPVPAEEFSELVRRSEPLPNFPLRG